MITTAQGRSLNISSFISEQSEDGSQKDCSSPSSLQGNFSSHGRQFNPLVAGAPGSRQISYQQRRLPEPQNQDPVIQLETQAS